MLLTPDRPIQDPTLAGYQGLTGLEAGLQDFCNVASPAVGSGFPLPVLADPDQQSGAKQVAILLDASADSIASHA